MLGQLCRIIKPQRGMGRSGVYKKTKEEWKENKMKAAQPPDP